MLLSTFFEAFYLKPRGALFAFMRKETLGFFVGSTVRLLQSHVACQPGVLFVTLPGLCWLCWDPTNGPRLPVHVRCIIRMILAFFADSAMIYDPSPTARLTMPCHSVQA